MSSPFPTLPGRLVMGPPVTSTVHVVPVAGTPGEPGEPGTPGPQGPPGSAAEQVLLSRTAFSALSGHRVVTITSDSQLTYASNDMAWQLEVPLWLTLGAFADGATGLVLAYGPVVEPSWSWTPGPLYLGTNGLLTQDPPQPPEALFSVQVGYATSQTGVFFERRPSISLTQE